MAVELQQYITCIFFEGAVKGQYFIPVAGGLFIESGLLLLEQ